MLKVRVVLVAPAMSLKVVPPSVLTCHCTVGVGLPLAAAVKVAVCPAVTVWFVGFVVIAGAWVACSVVRVKFVELYTGTRAKPPGKVRPVSVAKSLPVVRETKGMIS